MSTETLEAVHRAAQEAYAAGLWARPAVGNGSKRPWTADGTWGVERLTAATLKTLYPGRVSLGIETGHGGIEAMDFDDRATYDDVRRAAEDAGLTPLLDRIEHGYCDDTPGGGVRWLYRCPQPDGNLKLARRPIPATERTDAHEKVKALIETRGTGGFAIVAPSNGATHPSGRPYVRRSGSFATIATITTDERIALFDLLRSFDELPKPDEHHAPRASASAPGARPGDDFCARATWASVLEPHGWRPGLRRGEVQHWTRPGKKFGTSATTNANGADLFYVFSSSTEFEAERGYNKFSVYAILEHAADFASAARALGAKGYGDQTPPARAVRPTAAAASNATLKATTYAPVRPALGAGELNLVQASTVDAVPVTWIRPGHLAAGKVTLLVGDPGARKTWYAADTTARVSRGALWPEGGRAPLGSVLYFTAEDGAADTIKPRLDGCGADSARVWIVSGVGQDEQQRAAHVTDLPAIARALDVTQASGIVLDPLDDLLSGIDTHKNTDLRAALIPLVRLASERGVWILAIAHGTKANVRAIYKAQGSVGYTGVSRIVLGVAKDRNDPTRSIVATIKNNLGPDVPTLAFRVIDSTPVWDSSGVEGVTGDDLWAEPSKGSERAADAVSWLRDFLLNREADGVPSEHIQKEATDAGISRNALWRAKDTLRVRARRTGGIGSRGAWLWWLPLDPSAAGMDESDPDPAGAKSTAPTTHTDRTLRTDSAENSLSVLRVPLTIPPHARATPDDGEVLL